MGSVSHTKEYWLLMALGWPPSSPSPPRGNCWSCTIGVAPGAPPDPAPPWTSGPGATASSNTTTGTSSSWPPPLPAFSFSCLSLAAAAAAAATSGADASSAPGCGGSVHEGGSGGWGGWWEVFCSGQEWREDRLIVEGRKLWQQPPLDTPQSRVLSPPPMEDGSWAAVRGGPHLHTVTRSEGHEGGGGIGVAAIALAHPCMAPGLLSAWGRGQRGDRWDVGVGQRERSDRDIRHRGEGGGPG